MASERQTGLILSHVEIWVGELEQAIQSFEETLSQAEQRMREIEQLELADEAEDIENLQLLLTSALHTSHEAEARVTSANTALSEALSEAERMLQSSDPSEALTPLQVGAVICGGRYRIVQHLYSRPRVHLYLARRLTESLSTGADAQQLVAVRELVLNGLTPELRECITSAAFEEFATPQLFGTPHFPGIGDRGYVENERHYLVMQARQARGKTPTFAMLLSELLPSQAQKSRTRLDVSTALSWGVRLCQTVAHLHRMHNILGELTPEMLLVNREGKANWAPILLASWPPAPRFWPGPNQGEEYHQVFPAKHESTSTTVNEHGFAAPEIHEGLRDERSDIYALGAILYLLLTSQAPPPAVQRLQAEGLPKAGRSERYMQMMRRNFLNWQRPSHVREQSQALIPPHLLNRRISPLLEHIVLRALALNPEHRFTTARDLAEALEGVQVKMGAGAVSQVKASRLRKLLEWIRK